MQTCFIIAFQRVKPPTTFFIWVKVFKNGPCKTCGRQPLKFEIIWSAWADHITSNFFKAVFHKSYLVHLNTLTHLLANVLVWLLVRMENRVGVSSVFFWGKYKTWWLLILTSIHEIDMGLIRNRYVVKKFYQQYVKRIALKTERNF